MHDRYHHRNPRPSTHSAATVLAVAVCGVLLAIPAAVALALAVRLFRTVAGF